MGEKDTRCLMMRKGICLIILLSLVLSGCAQLQPQGAGSPKKAVATPMTWERINSVPIANGDMTQAQLRQICVDFFRLQLSFQWTPKEDFTFHINTFDLDPAYTAGTVYAGSPYISPSIAGNLYRAMEFYDPETGIMDNTQLPSQQFAEILANDCVSGPFWGWSRVINSVTKYNNYYMNQMHGCIPIGPYHYEGVITWGEDHTTKMVCNENGRETMYASYACLQPADGIYTQTGTAKKSHLRMICEAPVVVYAPDGTVDGSKSYVRYIDQGTYYEQQQLDNTVVLIPGGLDVKVSFKKLYDHGYLPFTFAELIGKDPVEPAEITTERMNLEEFSLKELARGMIGCNYAISHCTLELKDAKGTVTYRKTAYADKIDARTIYAGLTVDKAEIEKLLQTGPQTAQLTCRIGTGQLMTIYNGPLH